MRRTRWGGGVCAAVLCATALLRQVAHAQASDLVRQGPWAVEAPTGGCGSLPLLPVKGPGSLFDAANASQLASLQDALAAPLAKACPGVTEAILVNGRTRKLIRIHGAEQATAPVAAPASAAAPAPAAASSGAASQSTADGSGRRPLGTSAQGGSMVAAAPQSATAASIPASGGAPPVLPLRSSLPSLSGAHGTQAKCDVLFRWLELGKSSAPVRRVSTVVPAQELEIFRDDTMTAVFGKPYDSLDNGARIDLFEKTFGPCTGEARRVPNRPPVNQRPLNVGGINLGRITVGEPERPLPPEYRQEFAQYDELLQESFGGRPGRFEPAAISRFLQQVREQIDWANLTVSAAAAAPATSGAFRHLQEDDHQISTKASMLRSDERELIRSYLERRESDLAPAVVQAWLSSAAGAPKTTESANALLGMHREMAGPLSALSQEQRAAEEAEYAKLLDSEVEPALLAESSKVTSLPANWQGAQQLGTEEAAFLARFGQFAGSGSYTQALAQFDTARNRIYPAVLPEWRRKVAAAQLQSGDIAALRDDLKLLFVSSADRALPLFAQFEQPVKERQAQLDARVAEDERRRLAEAERAAQAETERAAQAETRRVAAKAPAGSGQPAVRVAHADLPSARGPMPKGALKVGGGPDAEILNAIYEGAFDKISLDRSSTEFGAIGSGYVDGFSNHCLNELPPNRVQIMRTVCDEAWVTRNGYGMEISRTCTSSHEEGTGIFADPELYAALHSTPIQGAGSALRTVFDMLTKGGDPISGPINMALNMVQLQTDAEALAVQNSCTSPALRRFQQNLQRFALGQEGLRLDGTIQLGVALLPPAPGTQYRDSDYVRLMDDMISEQGKTWAINRYVPGSVRGVHVESRDASGRPAKISASYAYSGFSSSQQGTVTLSFDEGRPSCLYFSDQPNSCRTPAHRLTSAYVQGEYR